MFSKETQSPEVLFAEKFIIEYVINRIDRGRSTKELEVDASVRQSVSISLISYILLISLLIVYSIRKLDETGTLTYWRTMAEIKETNNRVAFESELLNSHEHSSFSSIDFQHVDQTFAIIISGLLLALISLAYETHRQYQLYCRKKQNQR